MKVLLDENATCYCSDLIKLGYDVVAVADLQKQGIRCRTDYSILKLAEKEKMVMVSCDDEVIEACRENNMPFVRVIQFPKHRAVAWVHERLQKLQASAN